MKALKATAYVLAVLEIIVSLAAIYFAMSTKMVPFVLGLVGAIILMAFPVIVFLLAKKESKKTRLMAIVVASIMCIIMGIAAYYLSVTSRAIDSVTGSTVEVDEINVYVSKDDAVASINEAVSNNYVFGIVSTDDSNHINETIEKIEKDLDSTIQTQEYDSIFSLITGFEGGEIQSFITNEGTVLALDSSENYLGYSGNLKVIMENTIKEKLKEDTKQVIDKDTFCVYFSGIDTFGSVTARSRSDVNIIGVVNNKTKTILLLSTPRDYFIELSNSNGKKDKLTHAGIYGIDVSMESLEMLYNVDLSYYVRINFSGFQDIINTLGGVDVYSEQEFESVTEEGTYYYDAGINHLNGEEALGFARARYAFIDGDRQRGRNQMQVIKATIEKLESKETLKNYATLMDNMSGSFQTDMTKDNIGYLVQSTLDEGGWKVLTYSVSGSDAEEVCYSLGGSAYVMLPNEADVDYGTELIYKVLSGQSLTQDEINEYIEKKDNEDNITEQSFEEETDESESSDSESSEVE
ncbi:MAG: LCP family protein [Eubacterium sp.]|nr:LCP family protein [Eubacterium sp.]